MSVATKPLRPVLVRVVFAVLPIGGVLLLGWDGGAVVAYYWAANVAILCTQPLFIVLAALQPRGAQAMPPDTPVVGSVVPTGDGATWAPPNPRDAILFDQETEPRTDAALFVRTRDGSGRTVFVPSAAGVAFSCLFFTFHFGMFTLVHLVFLVAFGLITPAVLPGAILAQTVRRFVVERRVEVARARHGFPIHLYGGVAVLHIVILGVGYAGAVLDRSASTPAALLLCAVGAVVELVKDRRRSS